MKIHHVITLILFIFITGCVQNIEGLKSESKVRDLMDRAAALEKAEAYHQAALGYATVADHYPSSSYYKSAVWKAALLNIHPLNPEINYATARHWFQVYLGLPLSHEEKEKATVYVSMIERIKDLQAERSALVKEKDELLATTRKQSDDMASDARRLKELEAELANAFDELNKMKAVDVEIHRSKVNEPVRKAPPLIQKVPEPKSDTGKKESQSRQHSSKDQEFYPYMIQVASYKDKKDSLREAMILRDKGDNVCVSQAHIVGKGDWYRVLVGFYRTPEEAQKGVLELKQREYHHAFIVRRPFAVEIGIFPGDETLKELEADLISKGYSAYSLSDKADKSKFRLLVGAFWTEKEAETVSNNLLEVGFKPKVVRR